VSRENGEQLQPEPDVPCHCSTIVLRAEERRWRTYCNPATGEEARKLIVPSAVVKLRRWWIADGLVLNCSFSNAPLPFVDLLATKAAECPDGG